MAISGLSDTELRRTVWTIHNGRCGFCDEPVDFASMDIDHVKPRAVGGLSDLENLRPSHAACNRAHGLRTVRRYKAEHPEEEFSRSGVLFLRVDKELKDALTQWAADEDRSLAMHVLHMLKVALRREGLLAPITVPYPPVAE